MSHPSPPSPHIPQRPLSSFARTLGRLLPSPAPILAAVSGGADSVALALNLHAAGHLAGIAHLDHALRGPASAADATFVASLAARLAVPCYAERLDPAAPDFRRPRESLEMACRRHRRAFYRRAAEKLGVQFIATGHTADDQAETLLLRILRGTSPAGLRGIPPRARLDEKSPQIELLRPLLDTPRAAIEKWLNAHHQPWRTDATNAAPFALRNRIRNTILPLIKREINPRAPEALLRLSSILRASPTPLGAARADAARQLAASHIRPTFAGVTHLAEKKVSSALPSGATPPPPPLWLSPTGHCTPLPILPNLPAAHAPLWTSPALTLQATLAHGRIPDDGTAYLALSSLAGKTLTIRHPRPGDRIRLRGTGTKKISDLLIDLKVPRPLRPGILLLCADDLPVALLPLRIAADCEVPPAAPSLRISRT